MGFHWPAWDIREVHFAAKPERRLGVGGELRPTTIPPVPCLILMPLALGLVTFERSRDVSVAELRGCSLPRVHWRTVA
jgi:hypothetical protein